MAPEQSSQTEHQPLPADSQPREQSAIHNQHHQSQPGAHGFYSPGNGQPIAAHQPQQQPMQQVPLQTIGPDGQQTTYFAVPQPFQRPPEKKSYKFTKDGLHVTVIILCVIGMGLAFSLLGRAPVTRTVGRYSYNDDFNKYLPAMCAGPIFVVALLWSLAELIVRAVRKGTAGIHPGAHVGVCLCLWLGVAIVGTLLCLTIFALGSWDDCDSPYSSSCALYSDPVYRGAPIVLIIVGVLELVIFCLACRDTAVRNRWRRNVVITATPYWAPPPQGYYVQGQHPHQHQQIPMTHFQQPVAHDGALKTQYATENGTANAAPPPQHAVKEFYTPGTAQ